MAGFAFSGDASSIAQRFPYSVAYDKELKASGKPAFKVIFGEVARIPQDQLKFVMQIDELNGKLSEREKELVRTCLLL